MSFIHLEIELEMEIYLFENATSVVAGFHIKQVKTVTENYYNSKIRTCLNGLNIAENIQIH